MAWAEKIINNVRIVYWTKGRGGCALEPGRVEPLVWMGPGLVSVGRTAGTVAPMDAAQRLLRGRHPATGKLLRQQKMEVHKDAMLPGDLFAEAVTEKAGLLGVDRDQVLTFATARRRWGRLERALENKPGTLVPVADLEQMARAAGLDLAEVYDPKPLAFARTHRHKRAPKGILALGIGINFPKSVSLLIALASPELAAALEEELLAVVHECMDLLNTVGGYALTGHQGDGKTSARTATSGLMGVATLHGQARPTKDDPGDPHAHAHLTVANLVQRSTDGKWRGAASGLLDLYRFVPMLGEYAKARFRQRTRQRFGVRWERDPVTAEWEVAGFGPGVRAKYSKRSTEVMEAADDMSPAQRRKLAAKMARAEKPGDPQRLRAVLSADEELAAGLEGMLTAALSADPRQRPVAPSLAEIVRGMRMPRRAVLADLGVQRRQVTTALIGAIGDTLESLDQAQQLTDAVLEAAGFVLLSSPKAGSHHTATERYRTPALLIASSRLPVGSRQAVAPEPLPTTPKARKPKAKRQSLVQIPGQEELFEPTVEQSAPVHRPQRRKPQPQPQPASGRRVELDLAALGGPDTAVVFEVPGTVSAATAVPPAGRAPSPEPVGPLSQRSLRAADDQDLAAQLEVAQQQLAAAEQDLQDLLDSATGRITAAEQGNGVQAQALRLRRARLEEAADALARHQDLQLRITADRDRLDLVHDADLEGRITEAGRRATELLELATQLADLADTTIEDLPADLERAGAQAQWQLAVAGDVAAERRKLESARIQGLTRVRGVREQADQIRAEQQTRASQSVDEQRFADLLRSMEADRVKRSNNFPAPHLEPGTGPAPIPGAGSVAARARKQQSNNPAGTQPGTGRTAS